MADLTIANLHKSFGPTEVLRGIDLSVSSGEFVALLGPSGCGKSTLLRCIAGLETTTSGRIEVDGVDISRLPPERRGLAMMFQSYALFPHMSALENVRFPLRMARDSTRSEQTQSATAALELVHMGALHDRRPSNLSGGQQQRVALARAIVGQPPVLLLDEPLSNLDARLRDEMQIELVELHRRLGLTTIFVTHDQDEALSLADRVVLLSDGQIEQQGAPEEIYQNPQTRFAADFVGGANILDVVLDDQGTLRLSGTELPQFAGSRGASDLKLVVRQEDVRVVSPSDDCLVRGDVVARAFRGASVQYVVQLEDGQRVRALVTAEAAHAELGPAGMAWDQRRVHLLDA